VLGKPDQLRIVCPACSQQESISRKSVDAPIVRSVAYLTI